LHRTERVTLGRVHHWVTLCRVESCQAGAPAERRGAPRRPGGGPFPSGGGGRRRGGGRGGPAWALGEDGSVPPPHPPPAAALGPCLSAPEGGNDRVSARASSAWLCETSFADPADTCPRLRCRGESAETKKSRRKGRLGLALGKIVSLTLTP